ncbi:outer membrane protein assembly factor BamB family protein [Ekhidna sp. To15]|uniref:outer membrane protein assembly factor BamB family protein n=1 Tax=Ekhidna sp. To15 TaxID=3395267 RepID=UPI003F522649
MTIRKALLTILTFIIFLFTAHSQIIPKWTVELKGLGTFSSPRVADLNQDGIKDIIVGCGREEFEQADTAVIALNGKDGSMIWHVGARDQMFGSAAVYDIDEDGIDDVLISGRSAELKAISGATGKLIWEFTKVSEPKKLRELGFYNFYNPQMIDDQNGDGKRDILIANGGDVTKKADEKDRPTGQLFILDGQNGKIISRAMMPDGKEIYCSTVITKLSPEAKDYSVIFGTGGETVGGNMYISTLKDVRNEDLSKAVSIATSPEKGFIAPPLLIDVTKDGTLDVLINAVDGRMIAVDGKNKETLWQSLTPSSEAYGSIAAGNFFEADKLDFFSVYASGVWPNLTNSKQRLIDGQSGDAIFTGTMGSVQTSTPIIADITQDGFDDALLSVNILVETFPLKDYFNALVLYDFKNKSVHQFTRAQFGINLASTPWIGDLDGDGKFDIIYCNHTESRNVFAMNNLRVNLIKTDIEIKNPVKWGAYMGSDYDGVYKD